MDISGKFGIFYEKDTLNLTLLFVLFPCLFFHFIFIFFAFLYTLVNHFVLEVIEIFADISYLCTFTLYVTRTGNATKCYIQEAFL
jgi:hypothetical protein